MASIPPANDAQNGSKADGEDPVVDSNGRNKRKRDDGSRRGARGKPPKRTRQPAVFQQDKSRSRRRGTRESGVPNPFTPEEIASEQRRPKRKVAVMIGYSGTGYKGMQINPGERTIEGDLFAALVAAGAISRANADDHRKSSLVRCARTDKGVHAAGNIISLKLIVEDPDVVERINDHLPPQIRVWGIQRTNNSFSCYQECDSRWYEYLMPSYCLLPPHPESYLWPKAVAAAEERGLGDEMRAKFDDVAGFWDRVDTNDIRPILAQLDPDTRAAVLARMHSSEESFAGGEFGHKEADKKPPEARPADEHELESAALLSTELSEPSIETTERETNEITKTREINEITKTRETTEIARNGANNPPPRNEPTAVDLALRDIGEAYVAAKRRFRVGSSRIQQLQAVLDRYRGTHNFHNYTVQKAFKDASANRHIKSFIVNPDPILVGGTEWLSLKVHGQSFMMHQIRKMVSLATLIVRYGAPIERVDESYDQTRIAVPKAPGLGLLLERPVFETYNHRARETFAKDEIDFTKYDGMQAFKEEHIYKRIFEVEEKDHTFHSFFTQVDCFRSEYFLWLTADGITDALMRPNKALKAPGVDDEEEVEGGEG